jgi:hypothetical protein
MDEYESLPDDVVDVIVAVTGNAGRMLAVTMSFGDWLNIYYSAVCTPNITPLGARLRDAIADAIE